MKILAVRASNSSSLLYFLKKREASVVIYVINVQNLFINASVQR